MLPPGPIALAVGLAVLLAATRVPDAEAAALAAAIRDGDRGAFRRFFDATHADLLRSIQRRGLSPDAAEDVAQQAYVWIWEHRDRIDPERPLRGLLYRIGVTRGLNSLRDNGRLDPLPDREMEAPQASDAAEAAELRAALAAAVAALPERRRQTFELCFVDGLTHREAGEVMGVSHRTVEHQMAHALGAVREALARFL